MFDQTAEECRVAVAAALMALLVPFTLKSDTSGSSGGEDNSSSSNDGGSCDSVGKTWEAVGAAGLGLWLVLYGRCCLQWGRQLLLLLLSPQGTRDHPFPFQQAGLLKEHDIQSSLSVFFDPRYKMQQLGPRGYARAARCLM
jgi:hypothetical protein